MDSRVRYIRSATRLAALALAVAVALGLAIAPTASASAAADFTATSDVAVYYAGSTADIYLVNTPPGAVTLSWEWRPEGDTVWHPLPGSAD